MESLVKSDIFFFITSIAVTVLTVILVFLFYYGFKILKQIRFITNRFKEEGEFFLQDAKELRETYKGKLGSILSLVASVVAFSKKKRKTKVDKN
jgi:prolipoprotein diacylglyceryltransferase